MIMEEWRTDHHLKINKACRVFTRNFLREKEREMIHTGRRISYSFVHNYYWHSRPLPIFTRTYRRSTYKPGESSKKPKSKDDSPAIDPARDTSAAIEWLSDSRQPTRAGLQMSRVNIVSTELCSKYPGDYYHITARHVPVLKMSSIIIIIIIIIAF